MLPKKISMEDRKMPRTGGKPGDRQDSKFDGRRKGKSAINFPFSLTNRFTLKRPFQGRKVREERRRRRSTRSCKPTQV